MSQENFPSQGSDDDSFIWTLAKYGLPVVIAAGVIVLLYQKISGLEEENQALKKEKAEHPFEKQNQEMKTQISALTGQLQTKEKIITEKKTAIEKSESDKKMLEEKYASFKRTSDKTNEQNQEAQEVLKQEIETKARAIETLSEKASKLQTSLNNEKDISQETRKNLLQQIETQQQKINVLNETKSKNETTIREKEIQVQALTEQLAKQKTFQIVGLDERPSISKKQTLSENKEKIFITSNSSSLFSIATKKQTAVSYPQKYIPESPPKSQDEKERWLKEKDENRIQYDRYKLYCVLSKARWAAISECVELLNSEKGQANPNLITVVIHKILNEYNKTFSETLGEIKQKEEVIQNQDFANTTLLPILIKCGKFDDTLSQNISNAPATLAGVLKTGFYLPTNEDLKNHFVQLTPKQTSR